MRVGTRSLIPFVSVRCRYTISYCNTPSMVLSRNQCLLLISSVKISSKVASKLNFDHVDSYDNIHLSKKKKKKDYRQLISTHQHQKQQQQHIV